MKRWLVRVTESINHDYVVEAETREEALAVYENFDWRELSAKDIDGDSSWDSPWDVEEYELPQGMEAI